MKIYAAMYCPCKYESTFGIISIHKSRNKAMTAMKEHKEKEKEHHLKIVGNIRTFGEFREWKVQEFELLE